MLAGFVSVMIVVLVCAGVITFQSASTLLKNKAEKQIKQTAIQANGRLEALVNQIETLTTQAVNDSLLQQLMLSTANGKTASFGQRQSLMQTANKIQAYSSGVSSVEVYTKDHLRLYPLDDQRLSDRVGGEWIDLAEKEKGKLVWIGIDPKDPESVLAIRRINLIDQWFSSGGYLLVRLERSYFQYQAGFSDEGHPEIMLLTDASAKPVVASGPMRADLGELAGADSQTVTWEGQRYILVKQRSEQTGWMLMILYPLSDITEGISVLRLAIIAAGAVGSLLFIILSFLLSTMITRPLKKLMRAMRNTRQGVLTPNSAVSFTSEINDLNATYNQMVDHINGLIKLVYEKEMLQSRTELQALQAQINPHFLYNTLEALYWSLQEKEQEELADLVIAMSELFRYVIGVADKDEWVTVGEELEHVERYLSIMSVRFGSRLTWDIRVEHGCRTVSMPKLLIQPLVENAIVHGLEGKTRQGTVVVTAAWSPSDGRAVRIAVNDDGPGMEEARCREVQEAMASGRALPGKGKGMGLSNVQRRLQLYYAPPGAGGHGLSIRSEPGRGTTVSFDIPAEEEGIHFDT
nr:histidine kinase [Paenibacillus hamazuiensis]